MNMPSDNPVFAGRSLNMLSRNVCRQSSFVVLSTTRTLEYIEMPSVHDRLDGYRSIAGNAPAVFSLREKPDSEAQNINNASEKCNLMAKIIRFVAENIFYMPENIR
jgi:hypothetical protein